MQARKKVVRDEDQPVVKKHFFDRHPGVKWALIGLAVGLFAAAVAVSLAVTLGAGIGPFIQIGAAFGLADATIAATTGIAIIAGGAMAAFSAVFGTLASIINHCRRPKADATELASTPATTPLLARRPSQTNDAIAQQQADLRASATGAKMFNSSSASASDEEEPEEANRLVV